MLSDFAEIDPNWIAAVVYQPADDIDTLLADFAADRTRAGDRLGGVVQRNSKAADGRLIRMAVVDLMTGREISICQSLGSASQACKLDPQGLADAAVAASRAIAADPALMIFNKFSKQEASGQGLRAEITEAITSGIPVLVGVPERCFDSWTAFTGDHGTTLLCARQVVDAWWSDVATRIARRRGPPLRAARAEASSLSDR